MSEQRTSNGSSSEVAVRHVDVPLDYAVLEHVLGTGDLSKLTTQQRVQYYRSTCESLGLDFRTRPFRFMSFQGQTVMYATRDCADQLRNVRKISLQVVDQKLDGELFIVTVRATDPHGRTDEDMGAVTMGQLKGEARANAILKAITKAKRRVTLSICGLGFNDETEVETLHGAQTFDAEQEPPVAAPAPPATRRVDVPPSPAEKTKRTWATLLDEIEADAAAALTEEDLDTLAKDERVLNTLQMGPSVVQARLRTAFDFHRARVQTFNSAPPEDDGSSAAEPDSMDDDPLADATQAGWIGPAAPDALGQEAAQLIAAYQAAPTLAALESIRTASMNTKITAQALLQAGRHNDLRQIEAAYVERKGALAG